MSRQRDRESCSAPSAKYCTALWCRKHSRRTQLLAQKRNLVRNRTSSSSWTDDSSKLTWSDSQTIGNQIPRGVNMIPEQIIKVYTIENNGQDHIVNNDPGGGVSDNNNPLDRYINSYKGPTCDVKDSTACDSFSSLSYSTAGTETISMDYSQQPLPTSGKETIVNYMTNGFRNESARQRQRIREKWFDTQVAGF